MFFKLDPVKSDIFKERIFSLVRRIRHQINMVELRRQANANMKAKTYKMIRRDIQHYYMSHFIEFLLLFNLHSVSDA